MAKSMSDSDPVIVDVSSSTSSRKASPPLSTLQNGAMSDIVHLHPMNDDPLCIVGMGEFFPRHVDNKTITV